MSFSASPALGMDRSTAHPITQVKHPVALIDHVRIFQHVLRVDGPEVALAGPEHDRYNVHTDFVDQTCGKCLATDVASGNIDHSVARKFLRRGQSCLDAVDGVKRRVRLPALALRSVRYDYRVVDLARGHTVPPVCHVEDVESEE